MTQVRKLIIVNTYTVIIVSEIIIFHANSVDPVRRSTGSCLYVYRTLFGGLQNSVRRFMEPPSEVYRTLFGGNQDTVRSTLFGKVLMDSGDI